MSAVKSCARSEWSPSAKVFDFNRRFGLVVVVSTRMLNGSFVRIAVIALNAILDYLITMKHVPKENTDDALIQEFLNKGGKVSVGKTKPLAAELGLSNNVWNNKLTKEEKAARDKK
ncbi:hypothetical protein [Roseobacter sp. CCS2]|nr:hypothetical protein [Roseobacter sp. CCS2]